MDVESISNNLFWPSVSGGSRPPQWILYNSEIGNNRLRSSSRCERIQGPFDFLDDSFWPLGYYFQPNLPGSPARQVCMDAH